MTRPRSGFKTRDLVSDDGKRYAKKVAGSPFEGSLGKSRSCFVCGKHQSVQQGGWRNFLGRSQFVCAEHAAKRTGEDR
jgi:hypothetical protein